MNPNSNQTPSAFKRFAPASIIVVMLLWLASGWRIPQAEPTSYDLNGFGRLTVLVGGRLKPMDTVARTSLMIIHGRQSIRLEDGKKLEAIEWLSDLLFNSKVADSHPSFVIHNPEVLGLFGWQQEDKKFFSFNQLKPFLENIDAQGQQASNIEASVRTPYQTAILNLWNSLILYQRLKVSIQPEGTTAFATEVSGIETKKANFPELAARLKLMAENGYLIPIPPELPHENQRGEWVSMGVSLQRSIQSAQLNPMAKLYARLGDAYREGKIQDFNATTLELAQWLKQHEPEAVKRSVFEHLFNHVEPFYQCMVLYVSAFLLISAFWLWASEEMRATAFWLLVIALVVHTFGLGSRMYLQGRPPVTNLYSSAVFIGWGTVLIGLILERIYRDGIGSAAAGVIGFTTLIIAHHLSSNGDTLEMLQAVLDTNIWLATHVVTITIGYSAMFLAGILAIIYIFRGMLTSSLTAAAAQSLTRMVYGVICFATLFSFVGTVLGGIWADQSWGRFWGWDPKENGALLIVLWCAVILHARWGGYIRQLGLMVMAIFGNVITSFSWFGVNMLGVGLHSYGFMDKAFPWLLGFCVSQLILMLVATCPYINWKSKQAMLASTTTK